MNSIGVGPAEESTNGASKRIHDPAWMNSIKASAQSIAEPRFRSSPAIVTFHSQGAAGTNDNKVRMSAALQKASINLHRVSVPRLSSVRSVHNRSWQARHKTNKGSAQVVLLHIGQQNVLRNISFANISPEKKCLTQKKLSLYFSLVFYSSLVHFSLKHSICATKIS